MVFRPHHPLRISPALHLTCPRAATPPHLARPGSYTIAPLAYTFALRPHVSALTRISPSRSPSRTPPSHILSHSPSSRPRRLNALPSPALSLLAVKLPSHTLPLPTCSPALRPHALGASTLFPLPLSRFSLSNSPLTRSPFPHALPLSAAQRSSLSHALRSHTCTRVLIPSPSPFLLIYSP